MPAAALAGSVNNLFADVVVFAKPTAKEVAIARTLAEDGQIIVVDICDDHFDQPHYHDFLHIADYVVCPTPYMAQIIAEQGRPDAVVIEDPYEFEEREAHCEGDRCLWFGHSSNLRSLARVAPTLAGVPLVVVSNAPGAVPWSLAVLKEELTKADIVLMPATKFYKSPNRVVEAIRSGCFVVAEPHPAWNDFPIWVGNIREGIEWAQKHTREANAMTLVAQDFVRKRFSPETQASAWRKLLGSASTLAAVNAAGRDGLMSIQ